MKPVFTEFAALICCAILGVNGGVKPAIVAEKKSAIWCCALGRDALK